MLLAGAAVSAEAQTARDADAFSMLFAGREGGFLGLQLRDVRQEDVAGLRLPAERGAVVEKVVPESPAAEAGLKERDVIVEFDGEMIHSAAQLTRLVRETPVGRGVNLAVLRDGQRKSFTVKPREQKESRALMRKFPDGPMNIEPWVNLDRMPRVITSIIGQSGRLGIQGQTLTEQLAEYLKVPQKSGVLIASVSEGSPAQKAGLKAGDVIVAANGKPIAETQQLQDVLRDRNQTSVRLDCIRNGQKLSFTVTLESTEKKQRGDGIRL
jgi:serine protease Do